jgi:ferritin-like metal-binding protein YciE
MAMKKAIKKAMGMDSNGGGEIDTLRELLVDELKDLYSAEKQLTKALPKMAKKAQNPDLRKAFERHLRETEGHITRLERAFQKLDQPAKAKTCKAMQGLVAEGQEMMGEDLDADNMDAALIAAAQKVEHYEIASYGTVRTWAIRIGEDQVAKLLQQTLDEEGNTDKLLTEIAESAVNYAAAQAG